MPKFRACVGPSANRCHIKSDGEMLTLCQRTAFSREVTGKVQADIICVACIKQLAARVAAMRLRGEEFPVCDTREGLAAVLGLEQIT